MFCVEHFPSKFDSADDGVEVELAGIFLSEKINETCNKNEIGSYGGNFLLIFRNKSGTRLEKIKKNLQKLFQEYDLEISEESSQKDCKLFRRNFERWHF